MILHALKEKLFHAARNHQGLRGNAVAQEGHRTDWRLGLSRSRTGWPRTSLGSKWLTIHENR